MTHKHTTGQYDKQVSDLRNGLQELASYINMGDKQERKLMTDQELVQAWIDALRSGKYRQNYNCLRRGNSFCVTGVLCDIIDNTRWVLGDDNHWRYDFGGMEWYGLYPNDLPLEDFVDNNGFMGNNDDGWTFEQLADKIELLWNKLSEQSNE